MSISGSSLRRKTGPSLRPTWLGRGVRDGSAYRALACCLMDAPRIRRQSDTRVGTKMADMGDNGGYGVISSMFSLVVDMRVLQTLMSPANGDVMEGTRQPIPTLLVNTFTGSTGQHRGKTPKFARPTAGTGFFSSSFWSISTVSRT